MFVGPDFQTDALQELNLRSVITWQVSDSTPSRPDKTTLDLFAGPNRHPRKSYINYSDSLLALTLGEEFTRKVGASTVVAQKFYIFPGSHLQHRGNTGRPLSLGTVTKLGKWAGMAE